MVQFVSNRTSQLNIKDTWGFMRILYTCLDLFTCDTQQRAAAPQLLDLLHPKGNGNCRWTMQHIMQLNIIHNFALEPILQLLSLGCDMSNREGRRQHYHLSIPWLAAYIFTTLLPSAYICIYCKIYVYIKMQYTLFPNKQLQLICMCNLLGIYLEIWRSKSTSNHLASHPNLNDLRLQPGLHLGRSKEFMLNVPLFWGVYDNTYVMHILLYVSSNASQSLCIWNQPFGITHMMQ